MSLLSLPIVVRNGIYRAVLDDTTAHVGIEPAEDDSMEDFTTFVALSQVNRQVNQELMRSFFQASTEKYRKRKARHGRKTTKTSDGWLEDKVRRLLNYNPPGLGVSLERLLFILFNIWLVNVSFRWGQNFTGTPRSVPHQSEAVPATKACATQTVTVTTLHESNKPADETRALDLVVEQLYCERDPPRRGFLKIQKECCRSLPDNNKEHRMVPLIHPVSEQPQAFRVLLAIVPHDAEQSELGGSCCHLPNTLISQWLLSSLNTRVIYGPWWMGETLDRGLAHKMSRMGIRGDLDIYRYGMESVDGTGRDAM